MPGFKTAANSEAAGTSGPRERNHEGILAGPLRDLHKSLHLPVSSVRSSLHRRTILFIPEAKEARAIPALRLLCGADYWRLRADRCPSCTAARRTVSSDGGFQPRSRHSSSTFPVAFFREGGICALVG